MQTDHVIAPALQISLWLNTPVPITLEALRGRVVLLHAFQMLCPGCVSHGLPQATKAREMFAEADLSVIGLHTVFEHHDVMHADALKAFVHEYRLRFLIGIDQATAGAAIPLTMQALELRGTPSVVLLDRQGRIRLNHFGRIDDMALGALIGQLMAEEAGVAARTTDPTAGAANPAPDSAAACDDQACAPDVWNQ